MVAPSAAVEVFVDIYEPDKWADALATSVTDETKGMKHNLKSMGYEGDILIRKQGDEEVTWGIERKTLYGRFEFLDGKKIDSPISGPFRESHSPYFNRYRRT